MSFLEFAFLGRVPIPESQKLRREVERLKKVAEESDKKRREAEQASRELTLRLLEKQRTKRPQPTPSSVTTGVSRPRLPARPFPRGTTDVALDPMGAVAPPPPPPKRGSLFDSTPTPTPTLASVDVFRAEVPSLKDKTQSNVIRVGTWLMVAVMIISLGGIIALSVLGRNVPDVLTVGVSSPLGYFGGMFSAYFGFQQKS